VSRWQNGEADRKTLGLDVRRLCSHADEVIE
jgi:hypothetical protein